MTETNWQEVCRMARKEYNRLRKDESCHNSFTATKALEIAAAHFDVGYGIEGFCDQDSGRHGITYINMGDPYITTVCFSSDSERFRVTCYGNYIEAHPTWYQ